MSLREKLINEQRERLRDVGREVDWPLVSLQLASKTGAMAMRGAALRPRLKSACGIPLVGKGVRVRNPQFISSGRSLLIEDYAEIQGLAKDGIEFGDSVSIGSYALIRPSSYYSREIGMGLRVGDRSSIGPNSYIGCSGGIHIGNDVMLGPGVRMFSENHNTSDKARTIKTQGVDWRPIHIENNCWIASGVTVTGGVRIHEGAVVAAGAVVTRDVPPGAVVAGVPARIVRTRT